MISIISFASSNIKKSQERLIKQAREIKQIKNINIYDQNFLDKDFRMKYKNFLRIGIKGYGYWIWKPYIIYKSLIEAKEKDTFLYIDVGCHLNPRGHKILDDYLEKLNAGLGILGFQAKSSAYFKESFGLLSLRESAYTKGDVFDYFGVRNIEEIVRTPQIGAGIIFIKNNKFSREIMHKWLTSVYNCVNLFDDSKSRSDNFSDFISHRHDQSVFSTLAKTYNIDTNSSLEYWYPSEEDLAKPDWAKIKDFPIHAKRDNKYKFSTKLSRIYVRLLKNDNF